MSQGKQSFNNISLPVCFPYKETLQSYTVWGSRATFRGLGETLWVLCHTFHSVGIDSAGKVHSRLQRHTSHLSWSGKRFLFDPTFKINQVPLRPEVMQSLSMQRFCPRLAATKQKLNNVLSQKMWRIICNPFKLICFICCNLLCVCSEEIKLNLIC